jgi:hypothetical protein
MNSCSTREDGSKSLSRIEYHTYPCNCSLEVLMSQAITNRDSVGTPTAYEGERHEV